MSSTRWVVVLTAIGSLMAALDTLVVSTALSTIRLDLGASVEQLEWTVNAYNLSFAVLLITGAALGDRYGRRRLYAVGSACSRPRRRSARWRPDVGALIAARAVQGAGSALIMPLGLALLSAAFPPEKRGAAIGIFSAITGLAVASGPLVGGAVVEGISWEWIFWVNVPIGLVAIPLVLTRMRESYGPDTAPRHPRPRARHRRRARARLGARARQPGRLGQRRGDRLAGRRRAAASRLRRLGAARPRADAADAVLPLARVLGRQRGDLLHVRLAVRRGVLLRPAAADRARLRPARRRAAAAAVDGDVHDGRAGRRRAGRPHRRAAADGRRARRCRRSGWPGWR